LIRYRVRVNHNEYDHMIMLLMKND